MEDSVAILNLAQHHGINLDPLSIVVNDMGLDYRVVHASSTDGVAWILRIPRRASLTESAEIEARVLHLVAPHLTPAVPDWQIHTPDLIAYPTLPGKPGLTLSEGSPVYHVDMSSRTYALGMGDLLAQLHSIDTGEAAHTGIPVRTPRDVRDYFTTTIDQVAAEFLIAHPLRTRWENWLADDTYWPSWSVLTHGEIYPAHTLVEDDVISGVLDWTTSEVSDPVRDFALFHASAPKEAFTVAVQRYIERGGKWWPRLEDHCVEYVSTFPLFYALYAIETGDPAHRETAQGGLNNVSPEWH